MVKTVKRQVLNQSDLARLVKEDLKQFNISEIIIETIIKSYIKVKRDSLFSGNYIEESGIGTEGIHIRNVAKRFTEKGYTFKITKPINYNLRNSLINKLDNDKEFQEIMSYNINEE